jgi:hypothetical protein
MTTTRRIQQIAQQAVTLGIAPADTPLFRADVEFGRQNSMKIWDALFALRAGKPLDHSLPGVPGPRKRDHTIKGVPGEPDDDDTPEPERDPNDDDDDEADDDDACACVCEECRDGRCQDCSNPTCDDPRCEHADDSDDSDLE